LKIASYVAKKGSGWMKFGDENFEIFRLLKFPASIYGQYALNII